MSDWSQAAVHAAELLDDLETEYAGREIEVEVGRVMIVVELSGALGSEDEWTGVFYRCSDPVRWIQVGLLDAAKRAVIASSSYPDEGSA